MANSGTDALLGVRIGRKQASMKALWTQASAIGRVFFSSRYFFFLPISIPLNKVSHINDVWFKLNKVPEVVATVQPICLTSVFFKMPCHDPQCRALPSFTRVWSKENDSSQTIQRMAQPSGNDSSTTSGGKKNSSAAGHKAILHGYKKLGLVMYNIYYNIYIYKLYIYICMHLLIYVLT